MRITSEEGFLTLDVPCPLVAEPAADAVVRLTRLADESPGEEVVPLLIELPALLLVPVLPVPLDMLLPDEPEPLLIVPDATPMPSLRALPETELLEPQ